MDAACTTRASAGTEPCIRCCRGPHVPGRAAGDRSHPERAIDGEGAHDGAALRASGADDGDDRTVVGHGRSWVDVVHETNIACAMYQRGVACAILGLVTKTKKPPVRSVWLARPEADREAWNNFRKAAGALISHVDADLQQHLKVGYTDIDALLHLSAADDHCLRMATLARGVSRSPSALTRLVDRLEQRSLVERTRHSSTDVSVEVTPEGLDLLARGRTQDPGPGRATVLVTAHPRRTRHPQRHLPQADGHRPDELLTKQVGEPDESAALCSTPSDCGTCPSPRHQWTTLDRTLPPRSRAPLVRTSPAPRGGRPSAWRSVGPAAVTPGGQPPNRYACSNNPLRCGSDQLGVLAVKAVGQVDRRNCSAQEDLPWQRVGTTALGPGDVGAASRCRTQLSISSANEQKLPRTAARSASTDTSAAPISRGGNGCGFSTTCPNRPSGPPQTTSQMLQGSEGRGTERRLSDS